MGFNMPRLCNNDTCWKTGIEYRKASKEVKVLLRVIDRLNYAMAQEIMSWKHAFMEEVSVSDMYEDPHDFTMPYEEIDKMIEEEREEV